MASRNALRLQPPRETLPADYLISGRRIAPDEWPQSRYNPFPRDQRSVPPQRAFQAFLGDNPIESAGDGHRAGLWTDTSLGRLFVRPDPASRQYNLLLWVNGDDCDRLDALPEADAPDARNSRLPGPVAIFLMSAALRLHVCLYVSRC